VIQALRDAPALSTTRPPVKLFVRAGISQHHAGAIGLIDIVKNALQIRRECHGSIFFNRGAGLKPSDYKLRLSNPRSHERTNAKVFDCGIAANRSQTRPAPTRSAKYLYISVSPNANRGMHPA
jgi:hypothetical protein